MFKFNPFSRDASGFTKKDDKIALEYARLYTASTKEEDGNPAQAEALMAQAKTLLLHHGWTEEHVNAVLDHFHPEPVVYTDAQMEASGLALDAFNAGEEAKCLALLSEQGLSVSDIQPARRQYWDQLSRAAAEAE